MNVSDSAPITHNAALQRITEQIKSAIADGTPLRLRGGGSKDFYVPSGVRPLLGELLDTKPLNGIVSYEPSELVVTVRAGTPLAELEALLAEKGQCLPFEPPHLGAGGGTVGGMVAAALAGPARASVGGVRDYVLGLELLNGRAELLRFGGTVMTNVAGYDVSRMMVGAMGTLGLITEVSLKVLPVLPAEATLVFQMDETSALKQLNLWGGQPLPLNASRWQALDAASAGGVGTGAGQLHLRLRGAKAAVQAATQTMSAQFGGQVVDQAQAAVEWQQCRDMKLPFFNLGTGDDLALWRISVAQTTPALALPGPQLIEWHGGLRWVKILPDNCNFVNKIDNNIIKNSLLFIAKNTINIRTNGNLKSTKIVQNTNFEIAKRLKAEFDPCGVFNPQRLYSDF